MLERSTYTYEDAKREATRRHGKGTPRMRDFLVGWVMAQGKPKKSRGNPKRNPKSNSNIFGRGRRSYRKG